MVRGEVFRLPAPKRAAGHEQRGPRFGVVVQADEMLAMSTVLVAPTSASALPTTFRPEIVVAGKRTHVMVEHTSAIDARRLGRSAGRLDASELQALDAAIALVFGLR
jgi:mRNA interferase MazF